MQFTSRKRIADKYNWKCKRPCRREKSVKKDSIFEKTNLPITKFFLFLIKWSKSSLQSDISHELNIDKNSVSEWCNILREMKWGYSVKSPTIKYISISKIKYFPVVKSTIF